jgi:hypothetical protein
MIVTVKDSLDDLLERIGLEKDHELYDVFNAIYRAGTMQGSSSGLFNVICDDEKPRYYYVNRQNGHMETEDGETIEFEQFINEVRKSK